jgi:NAD(P)H-dependent flavin oxidoreductase YrpB (nitropropane dioxygenase family)
VLRTPLCDLLGIDVPIICAPFGPWDQVELAAAVSDAGGLAASVRPCGRFPSSARSGLACGS